MSYLISNFRKSATVALNIYETATAAAFADDAVISWSTTKAAHAASYNFTMTFSGSSFTIPADGKPHMFEASLTWHGVHTGVDGEISYQWYDTTNTAWIGNIATTTSGVISSEGRAGGVVGDEVARFVSATAIDIELRLKSSSNNYTDLTAIDSPASIYFTPARCLVYKMG